MSETIDSLDIQIKASATKADDVIDKLVGKLEKLSVSLGCLNTSGLENLAKGVSELSVAMQGMKNIGTPDFTRLAKNITKMGEIDSASIGRAASSLQLFSNSLGLLNSATVSDNVTQIGQLANGIKQLGYKSSTQAIENIPKLATAMRQLMTELSKAPKVSQNLIQMTEALAKLSRTGASSGRAATSLGKSLDFYTSSTHRASKGTFGLASALGKLYASYWIVFRAFGKIRDAIDISSGLTEVQNVVDVTFGDMAYKVEDFAKTSIEQFGMSELSLKQYASRFQAMGSAMSIDSGLISNANSFLNGMTNGYIGLSDSMSDVSLNLTKLTADMASFYNMEQLDVAEDLEAIFTGQTRPLRTYGLDLTEATLKEWAMKNGLDANIDSMTQAQKTMLRYQYVLANTGAAQGDFARTANTWANQTRILKQNFEQLASVIGGTFINALKPLVSTMNSAMSSIIAFAETVSNALGKIFGWKYESGSGGVDLSDILGTDDALDGIDDATNAVNKLKNTTLGIDEFNIVSPMDDSSGSGSGNGISDSSGLSGGQWVQQESILDSFKSDIDSLYELGDYVGTAIKASLGGIDWDSAYQGAKNFGSGLASFLNGLISPDLFGTVGSTVASSLNSAIYTALSFGQTFDFVNFGESIADGINNFFETTDTVALADTINVWIQGIWTTIKTAIDDISWGEVWKDAKDFLSHLDIETVEIMIGAFALKYGVGFSNELIIKAVAAKIGAKKLGETASGLVIPITATLVISFIAIEYIDEIDKTASEALAKILGIYDKELFEESWNGLIAQKEEFDEKMKGNKFREEELESIKDWLEGVSDYWIDWWDRRKQGLEEIKSHFSAFKDNIESTFDNLGENVKQSWDNMIENIKKIWNKFATWMNDKLTWNLDPIVIAGKTLFEGTTISLGKIPTFENGGYPNTGELFMARENGITEMVGTIGNRAAVANNDQIVAGIQYGVESAVERVLAPYLDAIAQNTQATAKNTTGGMKATLNVDGRQLVSVYDERKRRNGYPFMT